MVHMKKQLPHRIYVGRKKECIPLKIEKKKKKEKYQNVSVFPYYVTDISVKKKLQKHLHKFSFNKFLLIYNI